jgi:hypothetical protein
MDGCIVAEADSTSDADVVLRGPEGDRLVLLHGRQASPALTISGDQELFASFKRVFPGP